MKEPIESTAAAAGSAETCAAGAITADRAASELPVELAVVADQRYSVGEERGRGGIGRVSAAHDRYLDRPVAIKELLRPSDDIETSRFVREALITARLQHPGIVPVYEAGRWPSGAPFYAMKLLSGRSLHEALAEHSTLEERLTLLPHVLTVAETVAYAHDQGVIHRDLKPSNVVVGAFGETVVIDWGLAKDLVHASDVDGAAARSLYEISHCELTRAGSVLGTPAYMPPEQARGGDVDERADVYALGAILYRLLAGRAPYEGSGAEVVEQVLAASPVALTLRQPGVPRDLAAIVAKAMAREPAARYPSAKELAADLSRFLTGKLVGAREYTWRALVWHFWRRHRLLVAAAALVVVVLGVSALRVVRDRDRARALADAMIATQARALLDGDPTAAAAWLKRYPDTGAAWDDVRALAADARARGVARHVWSAHESEVFDTVYAPDGRGIVTASHDSVQSWDVSSGGRRWRDTSAGARAVMFTHDGRWLLAGGDPGSIKVLDARTGRIAHERSAHAGWINQLITLPDGRVLSQGSDSVIRVWRLGSDGSMQGPERELRGHRGVIDVMLLDHRGRLWSSGRDGTVRRWDLASDKGEVVVQLAGDRPFAPLAISDDGDIAITAAGGRVLWCQAGGVRELGVQRAAVRQVALRADGQVAVTAGDDGAITWWTQAGILRSALGHERAVVALTLSRDGETLASGDIEGGVRVWSRGHARALLGHQRRISTLAFSGDGRSLLTASEDGSAREWPLVDDAAFTRVSEQPVFRVAFAPDDKRLLTASKDGGVRLVETVSQDVRSLASFRLAAYDLALVPGRASAVISSWDGTVGWLDLDTAGPPFLWATGTSIFNVDVAADGRTAVSSGADGQVRLWQRGNAVGRLIASHSGGAHDSVFSHDGRRIASTGADAAIEVTELDDGAGARAPIRLTGHRGNIPAVLFSHDDRTLYSCGADATVRAWDLARGTGRVLTRHRRLVRALALSPDGRWLASGSQDLEIQVLDLVANRSAVWRGHTGEVRHLVFSPDGRWLASAGWDGTVRLWSVPDARMRVLRGHTGLIHRVAFSQDSQWLASAGDDGLVGLWAVSEAELMPISTVALAAWIQNATTAEVGPATPLGTAP